MVNITAYRQLLREIRDYLVSYEDRRWTPVLEEWSAELEGEVPPNFLIEHLQRSMKATGGMGSIGDLYIAPENGHRIADDPAAIDAASERLWSMTAALYKEAKSLLDRLQ